MAAPYTFVTGTKNWSSWSLRPYLALRATSTPFDEDIVPLRRTTSSEELRKRSPSGRVPVLKIADGDEPYAVWDSLAICETLAERHPEARLWPSDARARAEARAASAEMHAGFADLRDQLPMDFARCLPTPGLRAATEQQITRVVTLWSDALAHYRGAFLFGTFSIADCMFAPVCSRFRTYGIALPQAAQAYADRMFALPAMTDWGSAAQREVDDGVA